MNKQRKMVATLIGVLVLAGALVGGAVVFAQERTETENRAVDITPTAESSMRENRAVIAKGIVVPAERATLSMAAGGIVAEILVKEGQSVHAGDVILRLQDER